MPPSQLKRLKASLREQGIIGPQQSKKQKKQNAQNGVSKEKKVSRNVALTGIREQFNPFEYKEASRKPKFEATTEHSAKKAIRRPGLQKSLEEEARRQAYLEEKQSRRKVGGILDKRFGENDPTLAPEEKMLERFTREKQQRHKSSAFDLEEDDMPGELTHMGKSLSLDAPALKDDFDEEDLELSDAEDHPSDEERQALKRRRSDLEDGEDEEDDEEGRPERKKSKQEVMKELIAKSKLHKYERQAAKDDDEDLREELDKEMADIHGLLRGIPSKSKPSIVLEPGMNPERAALLSGIDKVKFDKEYDLRMRQMAQDARSKPTEKSKTEEQQAAESAHKLQELESRRLRRMKGETVESDEEPEKVNDAIEEPEDEDFGFGDGIKVRPSNAELGVEDEDDFLIDNDLIASGSELEESEDDSSDPGDEDEENADEEDDEFLNGLLTEEEAKRPEFLTGANAPITEIDLPAENGVNGNLAYKFSCPQSHEELLQITKGIDILDLPTVVQRIRALYHPKLKSENKGKLAKFSVALVDHISYLANEALPEFSVIETLIRHVHSLAKSYPVEIANAFRSHFKELDAERPMYPNPGDLVLLTAIGTIFPTSDHFHQVVTPAILSMSRYLGLKISQTLSELVTGAYLCTLCLQYQKLSKRYVPEVMNFIHNALCVLAPTKFSKLPGNFPYHEPKLPLRIESVHIPGVLKLSDCNPRDLFEKERETFKASLLETNLQLMSWAAELWSGKDAFTEVFSPGLAIVKHLSSNSCKKRLSDKTQKTLIQISQKLTLLLRQAQLSRRPLELHHHRPLAIKTSIPKFEESFNPDRHYDPDKTRTESAKLKKEHKREKKGAIRELRKDAHILASQSLKEKKERDAAYEKKYKRLIAEIQGEEGKEAKAYEREKEWRKKGKR